jgi:heterodisulfide reductase subunit B
MKYIYYPGCSLKSTGRVYEESLLAVFKALHIPFEELDDWNCCGATAYMAVDEMKAFSLAARNLGLAEMQRDSDSQEVHIIAPCSACYLVLLKTQKYLALHPEIDRKVRKALKEAGINYEGKVKVRHPLDVLVNDYGLDKIAKAVKRPLKGLKVVSYYGCQTVRPFPTFDADRNPQTMDQIAKVLGAEVIDWALKTRCCGGSLTGTIQEVGLRLSYRLIKEASRRQADVMITACPLCQFNLECYQPAMKKNYKENVHMPVIYFSQLMGMAFGLTDKEIGIQRLFISPWEVSKLSKGEKYVNV